METKSIWGSDENILELDRDDRWYFQIHICDKCNKNILNGGLCYITCTSTEKKNQNDTATA